ncbi:FAD-dependent oxidoreductase [Pedobacter insulae]|uniref:Rieske [2Fe-2S] domain-containing protein n=1 Tax=Pedobacter insulae TaxID=414048 RepID=A0A1I2UY79_9SPHI|nr:FAD-dependent oxidoreductase [Pedobacter insulae]SFG81972.1 Rieske [2Fe-2S] domain-containing protein [Pedobacter insulae]
MVNQEKKLRDGACISPWQLAGKDLVSHSTDQKKHETFDTIIIGGGITGLTTALLLQQCGKKCIVVETKTIGFGTTGGTSAHLNTFFDATYADIESDFGKEESKLVAKAGKEAMAMIKKLATDLAIDCDLAVKDGYLFAQDEKQVEELSKILAASKRAGIEVTETAEICVPIPFQSAIIFTGQGQFHPIEYIQKLAVAFIDLGGVISENTFVNEVEKKGDLYHATTPNQVFTGSKLVYATHAVPGVNAFSFKCAPYRSYVLGVTLKDDHYPEDLAYDMMEPYHYFRSHEIDGQSYLIVGGEDHKTGQGDPTQAFESLETYIKQYFNVKEVAFKWSSQYYIPTDGLPYIGPSPALADAYVATGFNGNGMMFGTLSAMIISDDILNKKNDYAALFSPSRIKPLAGLGEFIQENANVAWHFISDRFKTEEIAKLKDIPNDTGQVVEFEGEKLAVYKGPRGKVTALSPVCTHAGCIVNFNPEEKTWDCPCHGGRYDIEGNVISGPPLRKLARYK